MKLGVPFANFHKEFKMGYWVVLPLSVATSSTLSPYTYPRSVLVVRQVHVQTKLGIRLIKITWLF